MPIAANAHTVKSQFDYLERLTKSGFNLVTIAAHYRMLWVIEILSEMWKIIMLRSRLGQMRDLNQAVETSDL